MAYRIIQEVSKNHGAYSIVADTPADIADIGTNYPHGSIVYIIGTNAVMDGAGTQYMLNSLKEWILQP